MDFLAHARKSLIEKLWKRFKGQVDRVEDLEMDLQEFGERVLLDHLAIVDLPSANSGRAVLEQIFVALGFEKRGQGYLAGKQNDFTWMAEADVDEMMLGAALPQIVLGDFRLEELSAETRAIIERATATVKPAPLEEIRALAQKAQAGEYAASEALVNLVFGYLTLRSHQLPTREEFEIVREENELLAWVLIFGREVNHFGLAAHVLGRFSDLESVNEYLEFDLGFEIDQRLGKTIHGSQKAGILQSATRSDEISVELQNGTVTVPNRFVEMVWRVPKAGSIPHLWASYFDGFVSENADQIVESLIRKKA